MTNIIIPIRYTTLPHTNIPPALPIVLTPINTQRTRQKNLQPIAVLAWEELAVDVERDGRFAAFIVRCEAGDAIIFLGVDVRYGEGVGEKGCVSHCCG